MLSNKTGIVMPIPALFQSPIMEALTTGANKYIKRGIIIHYAPFPLFLDLSAY